MKNDTLKVLSGHIARGHFVSARLMIADLLKVETGKHWQRDLQRLAGVLQDGKPRFKIMAHKGNIKLPFLSFSSLPGAGHCPGAGDCLTFCYSFRAWRYPAAFCRQAQNSILMQSTAGKAQIVHALDAARRGDKVQDFRLYVDGDFGSVADVEFWMDAIRERPWLAAYGYSKSFVQLLAYPLTTTADWPTNYKLNMSSGHKHSDTMAKYVRALPITRGDFVAVKLGHAVKTADHANRKHQAELRAAFGAACFTCPGRCGTCTPKGHACGSDRFAGIPIVIACH